MKRVLTMWMAVAVLLQGTAAVGRAADEGLAGPWYGLLNAGPAGLRLGVVIAARPDGTLTGVLNSLDQGARDIAMDTVMLKDGAVAFTIRPLGISFQGTLSADGRSIEGDFRQSGAVIPLTLRRVERRVENVRPQHPRKPYPYVEEEVRYRSGSVELAGTLTRPHGEGAFPAVLLLTGSGAQDRDETILGHKPFLVLADHLTRKGFAVLRMDDRGVGGSTGVLTDATIDDLAADALAGVAYLKGRKDVQAGRIGLIGHSEGGMVAPLAASRSRDVASIVLLAAPGITGEDVLLQQLGPVLKSAREVSEAEIVAARGKQRRIFAIAKGEGDRETIRKRLLELEKEEAAKLPEPAKKEYERLRKQVMAQLEMAATPWFRSFLRFDPRPLLAGVSCPVLALNGGNDVQVAPKQSLSGIAKALQEAGNKDATVRELAGLNHLFQHSRTGAMGEYGTIEETFAPQALEEIAGWLLARAVRQ